MKQPQQLKIFEEDFVRYENIHKGKRTAEVLRGYEAFVEKHKGKKTTDDCYTPPAVYDAVVGWCKEQGMIDDSTKIIRPFFPDEDYRLWDYPDGCVVIDNPPFSIYAEIVRFFIARGIRFMLFGPQLTLKVRGADVCYLPVNADITYENGARVSTGFVTNMIEGVRLWTAPSLHRAIKKAAPPKTMMPKNTYPANLVTCATIGKVAAREVDFKLMATDCEEVQQVQALAAVKKSIPGGGWLLSTSAAAESAAAERAAAERAAAERAAAERASAERAAGTCVQLSEQELEIIKRLDEKGGC